MYIVLPYVDAIIYRMAAPMMSLFKYLSNAWRTEILYMTRMNRRKYKHLGREKTGTEIVGMCVREKIDPHLR